MIQWESHNTDNGLRVYLAEGVYSGDYVKSIVAIKYRSFTSTDSIDSTKAEVWCFIKPEITKKVIKDNNWNNNELTKSQLILLNNKTNELWSEFVDKMFKDWSKGIRVIFEHYFLSYDHVVYDLAVTSTFPIMVRFNRPDIVDRRQLTIHF